MRRYLRHLLESALRRFFVTETIGQEECPMMLRWTIFAPGKPPLFKVLVHYFPPNVSDRDPHDHPRSFLTFILRGRYYNTEWDGEDMKIDLLHAGAIRYRPAEHTHIVETDDAGAWTLVIMGPEIRAWGFLREGQWLPWKRYVDRYGGVVRCDTGELDEAEPGEYPPYTIQK